MKIEIKSQFSDAVLFGHDAEENSLKLTLDAAVSAKANLRGADLSGANLRSANLRDASLDGANLRGASLDGASLDGANLRGASLYGANLRGASLDGASLDGASLDGANLRGANLYGANLDGADLDGEILTKTPLRFLGAAWPVLITEGFMRIGCQRHTHAAWAGFIDAEIAKMADGAPAFWAKWKVPLLVMCAEHAKE